MTNIEQKLTDALKEAMVNKDNETKSIIRVTMGEINAAKTRKGGDKLGETDFEKIVRKVANDCRECGNESEAEILEKFLHRMLSEGEIEHIVIDTIYTNGFSGMKDMGSVMSTLKNHPDRSLMDGKILSSIVKEQLV